MAEEINMDEEEGLLDQEEIQDQMEHQENQQWDQEWEQAQVPTQRKTDSLFSLFQKVWKSIDSSKVANLNNVELGRLDISVRNSQYLNLLSQTFHHKKFGDFFKANGEIVLSTSASKKGWFTELFVSQKKFTTRSTATQSAATEKQKQRWNIFGSRSSSPSDEAA